MKSFFRTCTAITLLFFAFHSLSSEEMIAKPGVPTWTIFKWISEIVNLPGFGTPGVPGAPPTIIEIYNSNQWNGEIRLTSPGMYRLAEDIKYPIFIYGDNICLDLNNLSIEIPEYNKNAITVGDPVYPRKNVYIHNGRLFSPDGLSKDCPYGRAIKVAGGSLNVVIENLEIETFGFGVYFDGSSGKEIAQCGIFNCKFFDCFRAVDLYYTNETIIQNCSAFRPNQGFRLSNSQHNRIVGCNSIDQKKHDHILCIDWVGEKLNVIGFYSENGKGNLFKNCRAEKIIGIDPASSFYIVIAGFVLAGTETDTKVLDCLASDFVGPNYPFSPPYLEIKSPPGYGIQLGTETEKKIILQNSYFQTGGGSTYNSGGETLPSGSTSEWSSPNGIYLGTTSNIRIRVKKRNGILYETFSDGTHYSGPLFFGGVNEPTHNTIAWKPTSAVEETSTTHLMIIGTEPYTGTPNTGSGDAPAPANAALHRINFVQGLGGDGFRFYETRKSGQFAGGIAVNKVATIDENYLVAVGSDMVEIFNWSPFSIASSYTISSPTPELTEIAVSPDKEWIIVAGKSGSNTFIGEFDMNPSNPSTLPAPTKNTIMSATLGQIKSLSWSPDSKYLTVAYKDSTANKDRIKIFTYNSGWQQITDLIVNPPVLNPAPGTAADYLEEILGGADEVCWIPNHSDPYLLVYAGQQAANAEQVRLFRFDENTPTNGPKLFRLVSWITDDTRIEGPFRGIGCIDLPSETTFQALIGGTLLDTVDYPGSLGFYWIGENTSYPKESGTINNCLIQGNTVFGCNIGIAGNFENSIATQNVVYNCNRLNFLDIDNNFKYNLRPNYYPPATDGLKMDNLLLGDAQQNEPLE